MPAHEVGCITGEEPQNEEILITVLLVTVHSTLQGEIFFFFFKLEHQGEQGDVASTILESAEKEASL